MGRRMSTEVREGWGRMDVKRVGRPGLNNVGTSTCTTGIPRKTAVRNTYRTVAIVSSLPKYGSFPSVPGKESCIVKYMVVSWNGETYRKTWLPSSSNHEQGQDGPKDFDGRPKSWSWTLRIRMWQKGCKLCQRKLSSRPSTFWLSEKWEKSHGTLSNSSEIN